MFDPIKKTKQRLNQSFGEIKDDPFYFDSIEKYFRNKDHSGAFQILSDKTCKDLDFNELFMFVDRTTSKIGQQFLYKTLRTIPSNSDKFTEQEKLIQEITNDSNLRLYIQLQLDKLTRESSYFITTLFQEEHLKKPKWFFIIPLLSFSSLMSVLLLPFTPNSSLSYWE
ncbi:MAG: hypothetical protein WCS03_12300 [Bacteroidota bacterium]